MTEPLATDREVLNARALLQILEQVSEGPPEAMTILLICLHVLHVEQKLPETTYLDFVQLVTDGLNELDKAYQGSLN